MSMLTAVGIDWFLWYLPVLGDLGRATSGSVRGPARRWTCWLGDRRRGDDRPYAILTFLRFNTADRFMSYLLVPAVLIATVGAVTQAGLEPAWRRTLDGVITGLALVLVVAGFLPRARAVAAAPQENFAELAAVARSVDDPDVFTNSARPLGLDYYSTRNSG